MELHTMTYAISLFLYILGIPAIMACYMALWTKLVQDHSLLAVGLILFTSPIVLIAYASLSYLLF